jgi:hypothetical protein
MVAATSLNVEVTWSVATHGGIAAYMRSVAEI